MLKKFAALLVFVALFGFLSAPPGMAEEIVSDNLHDAIIGQWGEWNLQILNTSRYRFEKFAGTLPGLLQVDEDRSSGSNLYITGNIYGVEDESDVTLIISAVDIQTGEDVFQDLTIHVRHFRPDDIQRLWFLIDFSYVNAVYLENGKIAYDLNIPRTSTPILAANYYGQENSSAQARFGSQSQVFSSANRRIAGKNRAKVLLNASDQSSNYDRIPNAFTIEAGDKGYHYSTNYGDLEVPANEEKTFDLVFSYEYSRYFLTEYNAGWISLGDDAYDALKGRKFKWDLSVLPQDCENKTGEVTFEKIIALEEEYFPYIELMSLDENGNFSGIEWRIVKAGDPDFTPVNPNFDKNVYAMNVSFLARYEDTSEDGIRTEITAGNKQFDLDPNMPAEGFVEFDFPLSLEKVSQMQLNIWQDNIETGVSENYIFNIYNHDFVSAPEIWQNQQIPDAHVGEWYWYDIGFNGAESQWSIIDGELPPGLSLLEDEGVTLGIIRGNPERTGSYTFTVKAENAKGSSEAKFTINVPEPSDVVLMTFSNAHSVINSEGKSVYDNVEAGDVNFTLRKIYDDGAENLASSVKSSGNSYKTSAVSAQSKKAALRQEIEFMKKMNSRRTAKTSSAKTSVAAVNASDENSRRFKNALTVEAGKAYVYHSNENYEVGENEEKVFDIREEGYEYWPAIFYDDNNEDWYEQLTFNGNYASVLKNRKFSWNFKNFKGNDRNTKLLTLEEQLNKPVPYIELEKIKSGDAEYASGVKVRFVNKSNPNVPVAPDFDTYLNAYPDIYVNDGEEGYWSENNLEVHAGEIVSGEIFFNRPVPMQKLINIFVFFQRDDMNSYQWIFADQAPHIDVWQGTNQPYVLPDIVVDEQFDRWFMCSGAGPVKWSVSGNVPPGFEFNTDDGFIYGIPTKGGVYKFTVTATNQYGSDSAEFTLRIFEPVDVALHTDFDIHTFFTYDSGYKNAKGEFEDLHFTDIEFLLEKIYDFDMYNENASVSAVRADGLSAAQNKRTELKRRNEFMKNLTALKKEASRKKQNSVKDVKTAAGTVKASESERSRRIDDAFTIEAGNEGYVYNANDRNYNVEAGEAKTFDLYDVNSWSYNVVEFMDDVNESDAWLNFFGESETAFNNRTFTWDFKDSNNNAFSGSSTIKNLKTFDEQVADVLPYFEFEAPDSEGRVQNLKVRFVKKSNPEQAVKVNFDTWLSTYIHVEDIPEGEEGYWAENGVIVEAGQTAEGTIRYNRPVPLKDIDHVNVYYNRDGVAYHVIYSSPSPRIDPYQMNDIPVYPDDYFDWYVWRRDGLGQLKWSLSGNVPEGVSINEDGVIAGRLTETGSYTFTVKAENAYGSSELEFTINVVERPAPSSVELSVWHGIRSFFEGTKASYNYAGFKGIELLLNKYYDPPQNNTNASSVKSSASVMSSGSRSRKFEATKKISAEKAITEKALSSRRKKRMPDAKLKASVENAAATVGNGYDLTRIDDAFTIEAGEGTYTYWTYEDHTYKEHVVASGKSQTFDLYSDGPYAYNPGKFITNENGIDEFYGPNIGGDADVSLQNRNVSWKFPAPLQHLTGGATIENLQSTNDIIDTNVPYFEMHADKDGKLETIDWRIVNEYSPVGDAIQLDFDAWIAFHIYRKDDGPYHPDENYININAGDTAEGTMTFNNSSISVEDISRIFIHFYHNGITYDWTFENIKTAAPKITTDRLPSGKVGSEYKAYIEADGFEPLNFPFSFSIIEGDLPDGLELDKETGEIYGTPELDETAKGTETFEFKVLVENEFGEDEKEFSISIRPEKITKPVIKTTKIKDGKVGDDYNVQIDLKTDTAAEWSISPTNLGLYIDDDGEIYGSPTRVWKGNLVVTAKNEAGTATKKYSITINGEPPRVEIPDIPVMLTGDECDEIEITADGDPEISLNYKGKLPKGLTLTRAADRDEGDPPALILSGTPTQAGTFKNIKIIATNTLGKKDQKTMTLVVNEKLSITTGSLKAGTTGKSYSVSMKYKGPKNAKWSISDGELPAGITLSSKGALKGKTTSAGTYNFTVRVEAGNDSDEKEFSLLIHGIVPKIKTSSIKGTYGSNMNVTLATSKGNTPISWKVADASQAEWEKLGLTLAEDGKITGMPAKDFKGKITFAAANSEGSASKAVTVTIKGTKPSITTASLPPATAGDSSYSFKLNATGTPDIKFSWNGKAPVSWLSITEDGLIEAASAPVYSKKAISVKVKAVNNTGKATKTFRLTVNAAAVNSTPEDSSSLPEQQNEFEVYDDDENTSDETYDEIYEDEDEVAEPEINYESEVPVNNLNGNVINAGGSEYLIVATLPYLEVTEDGQYDIEIKLDEKAPVGAKLFWFAFADGVKKSEDDDIVDFADDSGEEIDSVPENRQITASPWLNTGVRYSPVIAVKTN